jgi:hypothetical protein
LKLSFRIYELVLANNRRVGTVVVVLKLIAVIVALVVAAVVAAVVAVVVAAVVAEAVAAAVAAVVPVVSTAQCLRLVCLLVSGYRQR